MFLHPPRRVSIVGNAPGRRHPGERIDSADWVVRFNNAPGFGAGAGMRCTHLALVNHGGQMREWLADPGFVRRPAVRAAKVFLFPFAPKPEAPEAGSEEGRDWTSQALRMLAPLRRPVVTLPDEDRTNARRILATPERRNPNPSTGFLVALHLLAKLPATTRVDVFGFGFAGWPGHSWDGERRWFERLHGAGRLQLHPVG